MQARGGWRPDLVDQVFGERPIAGTPNDLFWLLDQLPADRAPALSVSCGTEDELLEGNQRLVEALRGKGFPLVSDFGPGIHDWAYWDARIQDVLAWLPLRSPEVL